MTNKQLIEMANRFTAAVEAETMRITKGNIEVAKKLMAGKISKEEAERLVFGEEKNHEE